MLGVNTAQRAISGLSNVREPDQRRLFVIRVKQEGFYLLLALPVIILLIVFFIVPLFDTLKSSFYFRGEFGLESYETALDFNFRGVDYWKIWQTTIELSTTTTIACIILGYPVAYFLTTSSGKARGMVLIAVLIPFITSLIAQTYSWRVILGRRGPVNDIIQALRISDEPWELLFNQTSVSVGMVHLFLPFMILPLFAVMRGIPPNLPRMAQSLGATPFQAFRHIFLPMSMPGVFAGAMLVLILSAGHTVAPTVLGTINDRGMASFIGNAGSVSAARAMILLAVILLLYLIFARFIGFGAMYRAGDALMHMRANWDGMDRRRRIVLPIVVSLISFYLILPSLIVIPLGFNAKQFIYFPPKDFSFRWIKNYFTSGESGFNWIDATVTSLEVAVLVVVVAVPLGALVSYGLVRGSFPGKGLLSSLVLTPLIIPTTMTALALWLFYFNNMNLLMGTVIGLAIPHTLIALPFVVIILNATLRSADVVHEQAAMSLGASRWKTWIRVLLPQVYPGMIVAGMFAFLVSFNEAIIAGWLRDPTFRTLPVNMWDGVTAEFAPMMSAVSAMLLFAVAVLLLITVYFKRKLTPA